MAHLANILGLPPFACVLERKSKVYLRVGLFDSFGFPSHHHLPTGLWTQLLLFADQRPNPVCDLGSLSSSLTDRGAGSRVQVRCSAALFLE